MKPGRLLQMMTSSADMLNLTRVFLESTNAEALLRAPSPQDDGQKGSLRRLNKPNAKVFKTESAL